MILTMRTDKPEAEIGLFDGDRQFAYETWQAHRQLAETIHHKIQDLLKDQGKTWQDITGVVVYKGPGSFTGLRIGMSVANGLAFGLQIPVLATSEKDWLSTGVDHLLAGKGEPFVTPEYGAPVHVTTPRK